MTSASRKQLGAAAAGVFLAVAGRFLGEAPRVVEWHRTTLFPLIASILQAVSGTLTTTIGEPLAGLLILSLVAVLVIRRTRVAGLVTFIVGLVILGFYANWGLAYHYPPLSGRLASLSASPPGLVAPNAPLEQLAERTAELITRLDGERVGEPNSGDTATVMAKINAALAAGFADLPAAVEAAPIGGANFGPVKSSRVSFALSRLQLSGYYFPWSGEAQINTDMPRSVWPRVAAHEKAHQRGFARENEATVIGVLACLASADIDVRYSGAMGLFASVDHDLARVRSEERQRIWSLLPRRAIEDFRAEAAFWKQYDGVAGKVSEKVNDTYLKAQGVPSGVISYTETTRLFLQAVETPSLKLAAVLAQPEKEQTTK